MAQADSYDPEDFPTKEQLLKALGFAALTAVTGFLLSWLIFVKHSVVIHIKPIDRLAAEGAPAAYANQGGATRLQPVGDGYVVSSLSSAPKPERKRKLLIVAPTIEAPVQVTPTPTPSPTPVAMAIDNPDNNPAAVRHPNTVHVAAARPAAAEAPASATNTSEPAAAARPPTKSWTDAWNSARLAMVQFHSVDGPVCSGVIIDKAGLVVACASKLTSEAQSRVSIPGGGVTSASVVSRDSENDLVLLRLPAADYPFLQLAPDGGGAGETLLSPTGSDANQSLECRVATSSGSLFLYRSVVQTSSAGGGLINNRGELVGVSLGKPYAFSGNGLGLAARAGAVQKLMSAPANPVGGARGGGDERMSQMLSQMVTPIEARPRPSQSNARVTPGESMGNYPLGLSRQLMISELGVGTPVRDINGFTQLEFPTQHLVCTFCQDRLVAVETDFPFYATSNGLSVGSSFDLGRIRGVCADAVTSGLGGRAVAAGSGLEVESRDNKITLIRVVPK